MRYLHIGCGDVILPKPFENLDGRKMDGVDHVVNGLDKLPFEDNTFDLVYSATLFSKRLTYFPAEDTQLVSRHSFTYFHSFPVIFGSDKGI